MAIGVVAEWAANKCIDEWVAGYIARHVRHITFRVRLLEMTICIPEQLGGKLPRLSVVEYVHPPPF